MNKLKIGASVIVFILSAIITSVAASETPPEIIVKEGPVVIDESMAEPKYSAEQKLQEKAKLLKDESLAKIKEKKSRIINKEKAKDGKSSRAVLQVNQNENSKVLINKLTEQGIKVVRWENEIEGLDGKVNYVGMHSVNSLSNEENYLQLEDMTSQFNEKYKVKTPKKHLNAVTIIGSVYAIDNLQMDGGQ